MARAGAGQRNRLKCGAIFGRNAFPMPGGATHRLGIRVRQGRARGNVASDENPELLLKLELPSDPALLCVVRGAVQQLATVVGLPEGQCRSVILAVDEALANIICHAYQGRRGQPIELSCRLLGPDAAGRHRNRLEFLLVDQGRGVNPEELKGRPLDELRPGGLGTHFIREIMDEVQYQRTGNRNQLRLVKYLEGEKSRSNS